MTKTVLALVAHPDDAELYAGGLLAKFALEGARVVIALATDGRCGSYHHTVEELVETRSEEARKAAAVLGAEPPILLGHPDFELDRLPRGSLREQYVRLIRQIRPDVVVAEDPYTPNEPHPDHREAAWAAAEAVRFAELPLIYPEHSLEGLEPHLVAEKYFFANEGLGANHFVDISETIDRKISAMAQHCSQVEFLVEGIYRQARQAGLDLDSALPDGLADPLAAMTWSIRSEAARIGEAHGFAFAEAYRYERYHPLVEAFLPPTASFRRN